jgi:hypothetical protein
MGATGVKEKSAGRKRARAAASERSFASKDELLEVLDRLLADLDGDPVVGPKLGSTRVPHRFVFPDLDVALDIAPSERGDHALRWEFSEGGEWKPVLTLEMDSAIANRYLQGKENLAIGLARGRIRISCAEARAALNLLPTNRELIARYREIIARDYPHLVLS